MAQLMALLTLFQRDRNIFYILFALQLLLQTRNIYKKKYDKCNLLSCQPAFI